jgi:hypothetical protein
MPKSKAPKRPLPPGTTVLYVRAPEELVVRLKAAATAERRSLSAHALVLLEAALALDDTRRNRQAR